MKQRICLCAKGRMEETAARSRRAKIGWALILTPILGIYGGGYGLYVYAMNTKMVETQTTFTKAEVAQMRESIPLTLPTSTVFRMRCNYDKGWDWFSLIVFRVPKRDLSSVLASSKLRNHRWKPTAKAETYYRYITESRIPRAYKARSVTFSVEYQGDFTLTLIESSANFADFYLVEF